MAANTNPIYSIRGDVQGGDILTTAAADYTGQNVNNAVVFSSDLTNGGFIQRLRFKAYSANNAATVARIYFNNGGSRLAATVAAVTGTPTGTPSGTGGTLLVNTAGYFAKIVAVDQYGGLTAASTETASVTTSGTTSSITWNWTAVTGAASYRIYVGPVTGGQTTYFTSNTNSFLQTTAVGTRDNLSTAVAFRSNSLIVQLSLPATTAITTAATADIDYPLNFALPPGGRILVGLGATVAGGWIVTAIGGEY